MNFKKLQFFLLYLGMLLILPSYSQAENIPILSHSKDKTPFNQVIGRALLTNPAINSAKEKLKAEIARSRSLGQALYNPEVEFAYENANDTTKTIGISQKIDWQGKRGSNINLGRVRVDIARIQLDITRNSLIADIARSTSNYERNIGLLSLRERILKSAQNLKRFAERKHAQGDITLKELQTAKLAVFRAQIDKNNSYARYLRSRHVLQALTGQKAGKWSLNRLTARPSPILSGKESSLLSLKLATLQLLKRKTQLSAVEKQNFDDPTVGLTYGKEGKNNFFGVKFSMPLPIRRTNSQNLLAVKRDMKAVGFDLENQKSLFKVDLISNHNRISMLKNSYQSWLQDGDRSLSTQYELLRDLLENGEINTLNYLLEIEQLLRTEESVVDLKYNLETAWIDWFEQTNSFGTWMEN